MGIPSQSLVSLLQDLNYEYFLCQRKLHQLKNLINDTNYQIQSMCGSHDWIVDYVEYDGTRYKCSKNCGAFK